MTRPVVSEAAFAAGVQQLAAVQGWLAYWTHRSDRSPAGFPDLVLARGPRLIFAELKGSHAKRRASVASVAKRPEWLRVASVTDTQAEWLTALRCVQQTSPAIEVYVWTPADWPLIEQVLAR